MPVGDNVLPRGQRIGAVCVGEAARRLASEGMGAGDKVLGRANSLCDRASHTSDAWPGHSQRTSYGEAAIDTTPGNRRQLGAPRLDELPASEVLGILMPTVLVLSSPLGD
mmetsp:Transcript_12290/g.33755  ORF Transcript_12290/g.33755 Transcript_12290/m.33755 type:complete len:110 (+) Transcript_12290:2291-2620(+)